MSTPTEQLSAAGVSIWLDDLSRERITSGDLTELISTRNVSGVTTNPTIFQGAIGGGGHAYAEQIGQLATKGASVDEAIFAATTDDVRDAADIFRPVYDATKGVDGRVSIEVSPISRTTPTPRSRRRRSSGRPSAVRTSTSRSPPPRPASPRSQRSSPRASP
nr:hypothetical protein GCM10025699_25250 [Microbacterium flavescens]